MAQKKILFGSQPLPKGRLGQAIRFQRCRRRFSSSPPLRPKAIFTPIRFGMCLAPPSWQATELSVCPRRPKPHSAAKQGRSFRVAALNWVLSLRTKQSLRKHVAPDQAPRPRGSRWRLFGSLCPLPLRRRLRESGFRSRRFGLALLPASSLPTLVAFLSSLHAHVARNHYDNAVCSSGCDCARTCHAHVSVTKNMPLQAHNKRLFSGRALPSVQKSLPT